MQLLLSQIPKGRVTTYKALAEAMGSKGYRQIGQLLHNNPEPDKYPCYKVVKTDGTLGGFALGCDDKIKRLGKDGIEVKNDRIVDFRNHFVILSDPE